MKATLEAINQMQADGVIGKYAIGGAVGATFYLQPAATLDVDISLRYREFREACWSASGRSTTT
jgi:hypothetical protein